MIRIQEPALIKIIREIFRGMKFTDFLFLLTLLANLVFVGYLGVDDFQKAEKIGLLQKNGEQIIEWFGDFSQKLEANEPVSLQSCVPVAEGEKPGKNSKANTWQSCANALFSSGGPFQDYSNLLKPKSSVYAVKCDKQDLGSSGAFIFEKLTLNPAGPSAVSPMEPGEFLVDGMSIRLSLCDTGYYLIKIGEFKL